MGHALRIERPSFEQKHEGITHARVVEQSELEIEARKVARIQQKCLDRTSRDVNKGDKSNSSVSAGPSPQWAHT